VTGSSLRQSDITRTMWVAYRGCPSHRRSCVIKGFHCCATSTQTRTCYWGKTSIGAVVAYDYSCDISLLAIAAAAAVPASVINIIERMWCQIIDQLPRCWRHPLVSPSHHSAFIILDNEREELSSAYDLAVCVCVCVCACASANKITSKVTDEFGSIFGSIDYEPVT